MYETLKKTLKAVVPQKWLWEHELTFRAGSLLVYGGKTYTCNLCGSGLSKYITLERGDRLCPRCGSLGRNRGLLGLLQEQNLLHGKVLHFSPARSLYRFIRKLPLAQYLSSDFEDEFLAEVKYDITAIPEEAGTYDLVICFHVLEHISDDRQAMAELFRVLKPGGRAAIQTPFKEGEIYENPEVNTPEERLKHFGQDDHVRIYSLEGLKERLEAVGFDLAVHVLHDPFAPDYTGSKALIATKPAS